jgi:CDP-2,3-bis-(O-geranylgeranyl)-sn-glycerol synthase
MHPEALLQLLILVTIANGTPVLAKRILGTRFGRPVDGGRNFVDGRPLFGSSKTVRGLLLAVAVTAALAPLIGVDWQTGLIAAAAAMLGDLFSSFTKRRLGLPPQSQALGLDQIPESLFPLLACRSLLGLGALDILAGVAIFLMAELLVSKWLFRIGIRERPY